MSSVWTEPTECSLCGAKGRVRYQLVHWLEADPGMSYEHIPRCDDRDACRARVAASKKKWPLVEERRP